MKLCELYFFLDAQNFVPLQDWQSPDGRTYERWHNGVDIVRFDIGPGQPHSMISRHAGVKQLIVEPRHKHKATSVREKATCRTLNEVRKVLSWR